MSKENKDSIEIEIQDGAEPDKDASEEIVTSEQDADQGAPEQEQEESVPNPDSIAAEYVDQVLRAQAELQNYKKRTEQRMQQWRENSARELLEKLLPVVDDFDILFDHHQDEDESISIKGVKMIYNKFMTTLKDLGMQPIEAAGESFDPNLHEAVMAEESSEVDEGHILKVWQRGFMFRDQLMRPAKVITAIQKKKSGEADGS